MKTLIIPDVHGRTFWKEPCEWAAENNIPIIFLGDFFDPYAYEGIDPEMAYENGKDILDFINRNKKLCTVLAGNHDMEYLGYPWFPEGGRHSRRFHEKFKEILSSIPFVLAYEESGILFTHAGITTFWGNKIKESSYWDDDKSVSENLNVIFFKALHDKEIAAKELMSYIGFSRGGWDKSGSCLWADMSETVQCKPFEGLKQIVGHTQLKDNFMYAKFFNGKEHKELNDIYYVDCRKALILNENGEIELWKKIKRYLG